MSAVAKVPDLSVQTLNPQQQLFFEKATAAATKAAQLSWKLVCDAKTMRWPDFIRVKVTPLQAALSALDARTSKFFYKMMSAVYEEFGKIKDANELLELFAKISGDATIRKKICEGVSLPIVQELMGELDKVNKSIVDNASI